MSRQMKILPTKGRIDYITILIYLSLVVFGWVNIYAAVYTDDQASIFDISQRYGMQLLWMGISGFVAVSIILIDDKYYHMLAYPFYFLGIAVMTAVMFFGTEVNGARAWIDLAGVRIQPVEFMKIVTALALSRYISSYSFDIRSPRSLFSIAMIIMVPVALILLQNDTGSAMVFAAFVLVLYREGFGKWLYLLGLFLVFLFVISFLVDPVTVILIILLLTLVAEGVANGLWNYKIRYLALVLLVSSFVLVLFWIFRWHISSYVALFVGIGVSLIGVIRYSIGRRLINVWNYVTVFVGAILFTRVIDYVFNKVLQVHQRQRILDLLDIEKDPHGWSYNVIQSKVAIGSGGLLGKGFLDGTQTKFSFVPEQSTDFIFCTVGEEWGFVGSALVVLLFTFLIIRLIRMGERQAEPFARVYCYCTAAILFMHFAINITMTIGLFPVVGIPLPFFSYGGSSLLAFTILLFIAVRLDSSDESQF